MKNYHNQSDNALYYIICCISYWAQVFCISLRSHYKQSEITHTWSEKYIFSLIHKRTRQCFYSNMSFFSLPCPLFITQWDLQYLVCCSGNLSRYASVCLLEAPSTWGAFQWSWQANNKSINHILYTSNLVGVTLSLLLATGQQWE